MSLKSNLHASINVKSPVQEDLGRVVNYDEDDNEIITYEPIDYRELIASLGTVRDWSLNNLAAAGINPAFSISTGYNARIDGASNVEQMLADVVAYYEAQAEEEKNNNEKI